MYYKNHLNIHINDFIIGYDFRMDESGNINTLRVFTDEGVWYLEEFVFFIAYVPFVHYANKV